MNHKLIPSLMFNSRQSDLRNQDVLKYKVWKQTLLGNWSDSGNWSNNTVPSGGSNVLFGPYQGVCIINTDTPHLNCFRVRNDFTSLINSNQQQITLSGYFTYYSDGPLATNYSTINVTSGDVRIDGDGRINWDNSKWNLSGSFNQKSLDTPVSNFSTINMLGSGKTIYSEDEVYRLNIIGATTSSGDLIVKGPLNISGVLTIPTGYSIVNRGNKADVSIYESGKTLGPGTLVLEDDAQIIRQLGYIGNNDLVIRDNNVGEILPAATYSAKNITIQNTRSSYDSFVFKDGTYNFDSDVTIESNGGGTLEVNNKFAGARIKFNRDLTIDSGAFSTVVWKTGNGSVVFGETASIGKAFRRDLCDRGGINVVDNVRGLAMSHKNKINGQPIIWALTSGDLNLAGSGAGIRVFTQAGHTVGYFIASTNTFPASGFGDISMSRTPASATERITIGDIADPNANRPIVRLYRCLEPTVTGFDFYNDAIPTRIDIAYPASPAGESGSNPRDARAMSVHYATSDIYLISHKTSVPQLFFLQGANSYVGTQTLGYSGNLQIETGVVGMDISRDGKQILVKTWNKLYHYLVTGNNTICQTLTGQVPTEILDYNAGFMEHGVAWGSGIAINDTIYTMETFNETLHDPLIKSPLWLYRKHGYIDTNGVLLDKVRIEASGYRKILHSDLTTYDFSLNSGVLHLSGNNLTSLKDFYAGPNSNFIAEGFQGARIRTTGDFILVGSSSNRMDLLPNTSGGSIFNIGGEGRAYFTDVRYSNASTGSTIYAYNSNDYGSNTNWVFGGASPLSGSLAVTISGGDGSQFTSLQMPIAINGYNANISGNLFLSISGGSPGYLYSNVDLFISGGIRGEVTGGLYVTLTNSGVENSLPIYIRGDGITSGAVPLSSVLYITIANSGIGSGLPISLLGGGNITGGLSLSLQGGSGISGGLPLYIGSFGGITSGPKGLPIYSHGRHASN